MPNTYVQTNKNIPLVVITEYSNTITTIRLSPTSYARITDSYFVFCVCACLVTVRVYST